MSREGAGDNEKRKTFDVDLMNREYALVRVGGKVMVIQQKDSGPDWDRVRFLSIDAMKAWLANTQELTYSRAHAAYKAMNFADLWMTHPRRRQYFGIEFFPNPDNAEGAPGYFNLWRGFSLVPAVGGSYSVFRDHLLNNVCGGDIGVFNWVFGWLAHMLQRPRERIGTALVLRGKMGTGKTKVGEVIGSLIKDHYFAVDDPRYVTGQFNAHMASCLLLQAEEAVWAGDKAAEGRLKGLVTSTFQMVEAKGIDPIRIANYVRLLMTSNEDWVVPAGKDERRFCVLDVHPRRAQDTSYFSEMDRELDAGGRAALLHDLLTFDLSAVNLRTIPRTAALLEQKLHGLDSIESWWLTKLMAGSPLPSLDDWPLEVERDALFNDYIANADRIGIRRKSYETIFGMKLTKIVPGLATKRARVGGGDGVDVRRVRMYKLPPLAECRVAFSDALGQAVDWPAGDQ
jgi:hypothetical protein